MPAFADNFYNADPGDCDIPCIRVYYITSLIPVLNNAEYFGLFKWPQLINTKPK